MSNEEKAKELTARMSMLLGTFIMVVKENIDNNTCLIKDWDSYIEKMMKFFVKELANIMIPEEQRLLVAKDSKTMETTTAKKRTIGRDAISFEEALIRARINAKPFDDEAKRRFVLPKIRKIYLKYLNEKGRF